MKDQLPKLLAPGAWLGMMGGGQLGRMFCSAAHALGYQVCVLDPGAASPAGVVADQHVCADYTDSTGLVQLAKQCSVISTEFENVPASSLEFLALTQTVCPSGNAVSIAQDRIKEKQFIASTGAAVAPYKVIATSADLALVDSDIFPAILKSARLGYDGKGQQTVSDGAQLSAAWSAMGQVACVLEKRLKLISELSVVVARGFDEQIVAYPVAQNVHVDGILAVSTVPANVDASLAELAINTTKRIAQALNYVGVLCVEFFVVQDASGEHTLVVNEMAPRPHNSGHYSIDACVTSQFEQQVRVMARLPLGSTRQHSPAVMLNILGDAWVNGKEPDWAKVLTQPNVKLHLYGKAQARPGRKMGHITVVGVDAALIAAQVASDLHLAAAKLVTLN